MIPLPIDPHLPTIVEAARRSRAVVVVASPGAGKTTRVPPAILAGGLVGGEYPNIVMLQPRRIAARASAERIADENHWRLGHEVGYQIRFEKRITADTRIRVMTEGILTRQLFDDPFLPGVGAVILDEFHERSLHTDVAIALLREIRQTVRDDLVLIVMSATLAAEPVSRFLGGCPIVRVEGRTYPIEITHAHAMSLGQARDLPHHVADALEEALQAPAAVQSAEQKDVLVFLPGAEEIRRCGERLRTLADRHDLLVLPLHGSLGSEEQAAALRPAARRKVILATNIAETSLTIEGVGVVIDSGLARRAEYDPQRGLDRLELVRISKASATQRAGRAGRVGPGRCVRLWSMQEHRAMADFETPEIERVDLCQTVLGLRQWDNVDPRAFGWFEPPAEASIAAAQRLLAMLGALSSESDGRITRLGEKLLSLPMHPRLGRLIIAAAEQGLAEQGAALAALLSERDFVRAAPRGPGETHRSSFHGDSDLLLRLEMLDDRRGSAAGRGDLEVDGGAARAVARARDDFLRGASRLGEKAAPMPRNADEADEKLLKLILLAYPDRVARRRGASHDTAVMVGGAGLRLAAESVVKTAEFFVALDARQDQRGGAREALVRLASAIRVEWLEALFPDAIRRENAVVFDEQRQRVVGRSTIHYRDLLLHEDQNAAVDAEQAARVLADAIRPRVVELFARDEKAQALLARLALVRQAAPEHPWPDLMPEFLADLLVPALHGMRGIEDVRKIPLAPLLEGTLHYPLDRLLEQLAPATLAVPSGSQIRLDYSGPKPVLAVRLQELFGWTDTPRIAGGRVAVVLHLLGPNYRPVQITEDLRSFWSGTYFQVRKDLRTRYPKHSWPEDPLTAQPQAKGTRRRVV